MTPAQCRAARAYLQISQDELAKAASVSVSTVRDFEVGKRTPIAATLTAMQATLEVRGARFVDESETSGVLFPKGAAAPG
ncbi:MAG TPA: helix-turn-helix transcriptional regulator [Methylocystis sp.]|jgi:DNA-binding transcriptional regulator YiaG